MDGWNAMNGDMCWVQAMYEDACQVHGMYGWLECQAWGCMSDARHVWVAGMPGMRTCIRKTTFEFLCLFASYHVFSHLIADIRPD